MQTEERIVEVGVLTGHGGWVTSLATGNQTKENLLVSASRDRTLLIWNLSITRTGSGEVESVQGKLHRSLHGHSHFISDVVLSSDNNFAITGSWDTTLRLWDLNAGKTTHRFVGHTKDVLSVTVSPDNRQIISAGRDRSIKLWNTLAECKYTFDEQKSHSDWISAVRFTPVTKEPLVLSSGWDGTVKLWDQTNMQFKSDLTGHTNCVNGLTVSPDGNFCASGGKDCQVIIWGLAESARLADFQTDSCVNSVAFNPNRYWLAAGTDSGIKVWDLDTKTLISSLRPELEVGEGLSRKVPSAISVSWSHDGEVLYAGYTDGTIRAYAVTTAPQL
jgi:guanine nucleotide-binding protein subunit beta-2-like 1 protein